MKLDPYIEIIKSGGVVAFPTETVYGLGADAWNPSAIQKVFDTKGRPSDNPLIVHLSSRDQVQDFASSIPSHTSKLIETFWPGPLSIILSKHTHVLDLVTGGLNTVALRMPDHPLALQFIEQTGPLVAPSANKSGRPSPTKPEHIRQDFGEDFPVIDGGTTRVGLESTVVDLSAEIPVILRPGYISKKEIEKILGVEVDESFSSSGKPKSPGQKYSHYKPNAEIRWMKKDENPNNPESLYLLITKKKSGSNIIQYDGNFERLGKELYDRFRQADIEGYDSVMIESFEANEKGITSALLNRIIHAMGAP